LEPHYFPTYSGYSLSTFFIALKCRRRVEVSLRHDGQSLGFQVAVRGSGISHPTANCNGIEYNFEKQNHNAETNYLHTDAPYSFCPFAINQDQAVGAYIVQRDSKGMAPNKPNNDIAVQASIRISGEGFKTDREYILRTNLSELRANRFDTNKLIPTGNVTVTLQEIKEPSLWRRFLSSFSVTRTPIPK
jgi:hypothetical protein